MNHVPVKSLCLKFTPDRFWHMQRSNPPRPGRCSVGVRTMNPLLGLKAPWFSETPSSLTNPSLDTVIGSVPAPSLDWPLLFTYEPDICVRFPALSVCPS